MSKVRHVMTCSVQLKDNGVCNGICLIMIERRVCMFAILLCVLLSVTPYDCKNYCNSLGQRTLPHWTENLTLSISVKEAFFWSFS